MGYDLSVGVIYALHGFLGHGSDWDAVKSHLQEFKWHTPDLFSPNEKAEAELTLPTKDANEKRIFLGYSLGGRIGLSFLKTEPAQFDHYIFVSVNPGFNESDKDARIQRIESDSAWADKITLENWKNFLIEWNSQPVFGGSAEPAREAGSYSLPLLKKALKRWSLGLQPDYSGLIRENKSRITWIVGESDSKFVAVAEDMKSKKIVDEYVKIKSGHRIPFDSPKKLSEIIKSVAEKI